MALLESINIDLGTKMPTFELKTPTGKTHSLQSCMGDKGLLIAFTCNHCPYAVAIWDRLIALGQHAQTRGIKTVAINPNIHPNYPDDAPEKMIEKIKEWNIPFPYLVDETQEVAKAFDAQCTPDLYLLNHNAELVYHGRLDDNWKDESQVTKEELKEAIENLALGQPIECDQKPSMGCSIKWK